MKYTITLGGIISVNNLVLHLCILILCLIDFDQHIMVFLAKLAIPIVCCVLALFVLHTH